MNRHHVLPPRHHSHQRGFGLIAALAIIVTIGALGASLNYMYQSTTRSSAETASGGDALAVANAGMRRALADIVSDCPPENVAATDAGDGQYTISYTADDEVDNRYWITSTGYVPTQAQPQWQRAVRQSFDCNGGFGGNLFIGDNADDWNHLHLISMGALTLTAPQGPWANPGNRGHRNRDQEDNDRHNRERHDNGNHNGNDHDNQGGDGDHRRTRQNDDDDGDRGNHHGWGGWGGWDEWDLWDGFGGWGHWMGWNGWHFWRGWMGCRDNMCIQSTEDFALTEEDSGEVRFRANYTTTDEDQLALYLNITLADNAGNIFCGANAGGVRLDQAADDIVCYTVSYSQGWHRGGDDEGGHHNRSRHHRHDGDNGEHRGNGGDRGNGNDRGDDDHRGDGDRGDDNDHRRTADRGGDDDRGNNGNGNNGHGNDDEDRGNRHGQDDDRGRDCGNGHGNEHDCGHHYGWGGRFVISEAGGGIVDPETGIINLNLGEFSPAQIDHVRIRSIGLWDDEDEDDNPETLTLNNACIAINCPDGGSGTSRTNWQQVR